jgi:putative dehydrogenase
MAEMDTIGFIGIGKIGLPICAHLIKAGYRVLGYSRRAVTEFENSGGTPARSPEQIGAQANFVFACLPSDQALEEVLRGADGLICTAHPGQIVVEGGRTRSV